MNDANSGNADYQMRIKQRQRELHLAARKVVKEWMRIGFTSIPHHELNVLLNDLDDACFYLEFPNIEHHREAS